MCLCHQVDVNCACATDDEFWAIMMLRFGSIFANDIVSICTVVPVTCGPWRAEIAKELLGLLIPSQSEGIDTALQKQVGCFNHRVVTLVADKLERQWLPEVFFGMGV